MMNKWFTGRRRWLILSLLLFVMTAVVIVAILLFQNGFHQALKPEKYKNLQIVLTQESADPSELPSEAGEEVAGNRPLELAVMKKENAITYEKNVFDEYYTYERDGVEYVLYADAHSPSDRWTEMKSEEYNRVPSFNLSRLSELSVKDFKKIDGAYEPKSDRLKTVFAALFNIGQHSLYEYEPYSLVLTINNGRLNEVKADFIYNDTSVIRQKLTFSYDVEKLTLPH